MKRHPNADAGDVPAHTIGLGYDETAVAAAEAAEDRAWRSGWMNFIPWVPVFGARSERP
jgi:hypothetical protein